MPQSLKLAPLPHKVMRVQYNHDTPSTETPELWCFTKQRLSMWPDCKIWNISYPHHLSDVKRCRASDNINTKSDDPHRPILISLANHFAPRNTLAAKTNVTSKIDYVHKQNLNNCCICQSMQSSMHSPMFNPIPLIKADCKFFNWNDLASRVKEGANDCYTQTYPLNPAESLLYVSIAKYVAKMINKEYRSPDLNFTTLLHITHVQMYVKVEFDYRVQVTLAQTSCSNLPGNKVMVWYGLYSTMVWCYIHRIG